MKTTGANGIALLKASEGCKLKSYKCPAGIWTIGFGNTFYASGAKVKEGDVITQQQAEDLLHLILTKYEATVNRLVKSAINQNQFDALVDFAYNAGEGALQSSTLLKKVNANPSDSTIAQEFLKWTKATVKGVKVELPGLVTRRKKESELYFKSV